MSDVKEEKVPLFHRAYVFMILYMICMIVILICLGVYAIMVGIALPNPIIISISEVLMNIFIVIFIGFLLILAYHIRMHEWFRTAIRIVLGKERLE